MQSICNIQNKGPKKLSKKKIFKNMTIILPYKAKRVYLDKKLKIINFLFFTYSSTTFYSAFDGVILF